MKFLMLLNQLRLNLEPQSKNSTLMWAIWMWMSRTGLVRPTHKWRQNQEKVSDTLSPKILKCPESGCLYLQDGEMFIWALPERILSAGNSVTVMTYKAEGSMLLSYPRKLDLPFEVCNDNLLEEEFRAKASELIVIEDIPAFSKMKLTFSGQQKGMSSAPYYSKVSRSLKKLKERKLVGVDINKMLLTCNKDAWLKASNDNQPKPESKENKKTKFKPGVFAKNSRIKDVEWISNTTRGTNNYINRSHLIYFYL